MKMKKINEISMTGEGIPGEYGNSSEAYLTPYAYVRKGADEKGNFATQMMQKIGYTIVNKEEHSSYFEKVGQKVKYNYTLPYVKDKNK